MTLRKELGRILITGAGGRVATAFRHAVGHRYRLRLAERDSGLLNDVHPDDEVISFNIADLDACRTACADIDTVLHLSADPSPNVDFCGSLIDNNMLGTFNIFRAAKDAGCRRVVFASSAQVVEGYPLDYQIRPDDVPKPKNLYGASKAFGEGIAAYFAHQEGLSSLSVRIALLTTLADGEPLSASRYECLSQPPRCHRSVGTLHPYRRSAALDGTWHFQQPLQAAVAGGNQPFARLLPAG
ncbi:putative NAD dependent epimerase/dehydratase [Serratia symbiotica str. Tucson]|uniref:NAD dependent epimerase/dehydratase n=2 Tax=Serratia symbiotica TaxID=138074 RepID=A0A455VQ85_9GAMM|nr:putative NAD dependent epimerase/dehydratase [Serratia symbiotica str. Tucson]BBI92856.1 NAD dependent epimerase/dehydratase [Serratia symbiotica]